jgi:hypothetical protein
MLCVVFKNKNSVPDVLFYDNNCHLYQHFKKHGVTPFEDMILPVDVFHFKTTHSENNPDCGKHCNPIAFPDLYDVETRTWRFNSSAAEQTNSWLKNYDSVVHDLDATCFNFFLDEMIKERNRFLVASLEAEHKNPRVLPAHYFVD